MEDIFSNKKKYKIPKIFHERESIFRKFLKPYPSLYNFLRKLKYKIIFYVRKVKSRNFYIFNKPKHFTEKIFSFVEIETNPICNRKCSFCPISYDDTPKEKMSEKLFYKILDELKKINFNGEICLSSYGEPLLDNRLAKFISDARKELGDRVRITINTNGDFLTEEKFKELVEAGIDLIRVSQHDTEPSENIKKIFSQTTPLKIKHLKFRVVNEESELTSRGGKVKVKNLAPPLPFCDLGGIYIRWDGAIRLCCEDYFNTVKLGNLNESSLMEIWNNPFYKRIRNELEEGIFNLDICKTCKEVLKNKTNVN